MNRPMDDRRPLAALAKTKDEKASASIVPRPTSLVLADLLGKRFSYGGRGPFEYDCYGLAMEIYKRRGMELPDFGSSPSASWIHRSILKATDSTSPPGGEGRFVQLEQPEPFCLVTFMVRPPYTSHIGVVLEDRQRFIHIMQRSLVTIERLDSQTWKRRITGFFLPQRREASRQQ